jgi:N-acyl homoserine lactone hydrolase
LSDRPALPEVSVLCEGYIVRDGEQVVDASSTVALVVSEDITLIVDTGAHARLGELSAALAGASLSPEEVDAVVNTHLHMDHCGGNILFPDARMYAHRLEDPPIGTLAAAEGAVISDGISVLETPGHTAGSVSVHVRSDRDYVICGDALPTRSNYDSMAPPAIHIDRRLALSSMERIISLADVVVPGHDRMFDVMRKK